MLNLLSPLYFPKQATFLGASASVGHLENALGRPPWWCRPPDVRQGCCVHEAWGPTLMSPMGKAPWGSADTGLCWDLCSSKKNPPSISTTCCLNGQSRSGALAGGKDAGSGLLWARGLLCACRGKARGYAASRPLSSQV